MNTTDERLSLFRELATCTQNLTFSIYNSEFVNIYCNNEIENALITLSCHAAIRGGLSPVAAYLLRTTIWQNYSGNPPACCPVNSA